MTMQLNLDIHGELIIDNFAGGGGASTGIELALGRRVDIAINHDPEAVAMHTANHPETKHYCESVWEIDPREVTQGRPVGLVWLSPDCFPAGTMILTDRGYQPIETIVEGDRVLTHTGRYRRVYATMQAVKNVRTIDIQGVPTITVSDEHPFYARAMSNVWDNANRRYQRTLSSAAWVLAKNLRAGAAPMNAAGGDRHFCATPCSFENIAIPEVGGRGIEVDDRLMWLAGRYVGDGWSRVGDGRAELVITCGKLEAEHLSEKLALWPRSGARAAGGELAWHRRDTKTAHQFSTNHVGLVEWLRDQFGHGGAEKRFPAWALSAPAPLRRALLDGYVSADGSAFSTGSNRVTETVTISKALALSTKALAESLGFTATISQPRKNTALIDGRTVNAKPIYMVRWRENQARYQTVRDELHNWSRVQGVGDSMEAMTVFNISVEEDETYIADGIVVHNCKHFSKAKGGKPVEKKIRGLAWVALRWAAVAKPRVIMLENVEEFRTWGPLVIDGAGNARPCPKNKGREFNAFCNALRRQGYHVEHQELRACDYGTPTIRKRLFLIARRDGQPIVWPAPTHGDPRNIVTKAQKLEPWRTAAECIDWSIPCPSIFERKRELAPATLRRIAKGIMRYVVNAADPFIVPLTHQGADRRYPMGQPIPTITAAHRGEMALVAPVLTEHANASSPRSMPADEPLRTICAQTKGGHHALVSAFLAKHYTGVVGAELTDPAPTVTSVDHNSLVTAKLERTNGSNGRVEGTDHSRIEECVGGRGKELDHTEEVKAFLVAYYGSDQDPRLEEPLHTVTTKDRYGLVTVAGEEYQIADIGLRMLAPKELFRAQGFPDSYITEWGIDHNGQRINLTKSAQVRMCGNSVAPQVAAALVRANLGELAIKRAA